MTRDPPRGDGDRAANGRQTDRTGSTASAGTSASRRDVLRAAGAGATALATGALGTGAVAGQSSVQQIPTPWLHVEGNLIKDPLGETVSLRGVNVADPKRLDVTAPARGKTALQVVDMLTDPDQGWHPRVIRVPVQPIDIGEHEPGATGGPPQPPAFSQSALETYLETHLDPVVQRCRERGVYCIVDFHRHWHESEGSYGAENTNYWAHPDTLEPNEALSEEVTTFWETVAPRYADQSHVIYEVYNEPTEPGMWTSLDNDAEIWYAWKETAQPWVDTIREHAPNNLVLVGSPSWTQSTDGVLLEEFDGENLAYTYHIYPGHTASKQNDWNGHKTQGLHDAHQQVPVVVTEFGWQNDIRSDYLVGTTSGMGEPFLEFLESSDALHWTAWCADPIWRPVMFNRPFSPGSHLDVEDSLGNPYDETIPSYCEELPCEWTLLGEDEGAHDDFSGGFVRQTLADLQDDSVPTVAFDDQPPETPDPTVESVAETSFELSWDAVANPGDAPFQAYNVYLDDRLHEQLADRTTTGVTVSDLVSGATFDVSVTAQDASGNESVPATLSVTTESFDDAAPPAVPDGLAVASRTHTRLDLAWNAVADEGPAGLHHYEVRVDGELEHGVPAGTTTTTLSDLTPDTTYDVTVAAVDYAGNESAASDVLAARTEVDRARSSDLVVDDFDGDTDDGKNELGKWVGGSGLDGRTITDDGWMRVEYADGGWYGTSVATDVRSYDTLFVRLAGDAGGEGQEIDVAFAGQEGMLSDVFAGEVHQRPSLLSLDLTGVDDATLEQPGQLRLGFANGASGAVEFDAIWLRGPDDGPGDVEVPVPGGLAASGTTETATELSWDAVESAHHYELAIDGIDYGAVYDAATSLEGLQPGTTYEVGVRAVDVADNRSEYATTTVETAGDGGTENPTCGGVEVENTAEVDGQTVCDLNGDDLYRDVDASGELDAADVVHFFQHQHTQAWKRPEYFDFSGSQDVGHGDVVQLFRDAATGSV